jgi:hypothetical protein
MSKGGNGSEFTQEMLRIAGLRRISSGWLVFGGPAVVAVSNQKKRFKTQKKRQGIPVAFFGFR